MKGLSESQLARLSSLISSKIALHFPPQRWDELQQKLAPAAKELGFSDQTALIQWLTSSPLSQRDIETLASHLTIPETYFWREPQIFEALQGPILAEVMERKRRGDGRLRIWSAACASGEEPYSIAMALLRALLDRKARKIDILATDINPRLLRKAQAGVYGPWSFRNAPDWLKKNYCHALAENRFEIQAEIRDMVNFAYLNLAEDVYPSVSNSTNAMDIIFCRNVLMYFLPETARQTAEKLYRCLVDGGWLIVGACELSQSIFAGFSPIQLCGTIVYRKQGKDERPQVASGWDHDQPPPSLFAPPRSVPLAEFRPAPPCQRPGLQAQSTAFIVPPPPVGPEAEGNSHPEDNAQGGQEPDPSAPAIRALADQGSLVEALALCERAVAADGLDPALHYLKAVILQERNQDSEAIASLRRALYLEPNLTMAHFALGNLFQRQGNPTAAKRYFDNVLELLNACPAEKVIHQAEGLTAGRIRTIVQATIEAGGLG